MGQTDQKIVDQLKDQLCLDFSQAFFLLKEGFKMCRSGWKNISYIAIQRPDENSKMKRAYIYCVPLDNQPLPFTISNADLFMEDWKVFK